MPIRIKEVTSTVKLFRNERQSNQLDKPKVKTMEQQVQVHDTSAYQDRQVVETRNTDILETTWSEWEC